MHNIEKKKKKKKEEESERKKKKKKRVNCQVVEASFPFLFVVQVERTATHAPPTTPWLVFFFYFSLLLSFRVEAFELCIV